MLKLGRAKFNALLANRIRESVIDHCVSVKRGVAHFQTRDARTGFPHIYSYRLDSLTPDRCRLSVSVRGRWTLHWIGRSAARFWLSAVGWLIELSLRQRLTGA
jgi:hypothetical protein